MDERQRHVEVGAGLQDERINQDFKDWLERYSLPVLAVLLVVVGLYSGSKWYKTAQAQKLDDAFVAYEAARGGIGDDGLELGSPDNLLDIASQYAGRGSIAELATLDAADIYLGAVRRGIAPGANLADVQPDELLTNEQGDVLLGKADELYRKVIDRTHRNKQDSVMYQRALLGAASVAISRHKLDIARELLTTLAEHAESLGFTAHAAEARLRLEALDDYAAPVVLLTNQEVDPIENDPFIEKTADGEYLLKRMPEGFVPPGFDPSQFPEGFGQPKPKPDAGADQPAPPATGPQPKDPDGPTSDPSGS